MYKIYNLVSFSTKNLIEVTNCNYVSFCMTIIQTIAISSWRMYSSFTAKRLTRENRRRFFEMIILRIAASFEFPENFAPPPAVQLLIRPS